MNPTISVIVPVYNVEKTLDRCMQSILSQTFSNYEVILVDDGSTDGSGALCDTYEQQYENIRVIHKANEGLGPTRNLGIKEAKGEFIYHCDSDDWIKEDLLEKSYAAITAANADVCIFGYDIFTMKNDEIVSYDTIRISNATLSTANEVRELFVKQYYNSFIVQSACNRLYRRSFLINNNLFFPPLRRCQDIAYSLLLFDKIEKLVTLEDTYYCYIIEPGVYKGRSYQEMVDIYFTVHNLILKQFKAWNLLSKEQEQALLNLSCERIANYSAYAFSVKYKDRWRENTQYLLKSSQIVKLFSYYKNEKKSKFMFLFCLGIRLKSKHVLLWVSQLVQRKVK